MMHKWDAGRALELIKRERITHMTGVPTMSQDLMEHRTLQKEMFPV